MFEACAERCAGEEFVFCAVDGSSVTVTDSNDEKDLGSIGARSQGARGVKVISALAISAKGVPQGLTSQTWWKRTASLARRVKQKHRNVRRTEEKEIQRWLDTMEQARQVISRLSVQRHHPVPAAVESGLADLLLSSTTGPIDLSAIDFETPPQG